MGSLVVRPTIRLDDDERSMLNIGRQVNMVNDDEQAKATLNLGGEDYSERGFATAKGRE